MKLNETIGCGRTGILESRNCLLLLSLLAFWVLTAQAVPPPAGVAPVVAPPGGLAIDGNLLANTPFADAGDWLSGAAGTGGAALAPNGAPLDPTTTFHFVDAYNADNDETFIGGLKWTDSPNTWGWTTGKASGKTDINNVLLHVTTDADGHTWVIVSADRLSTSGDSYIDFEFLQNSLTRKTDGTFSSAGPNGGRTTNDLVLCLAFTDGGSVADFFAYRWIRSGSGFAYVDATAALPAGRVFVAANPTNAAVPYGAFGQTNYTANAYAEAALDLTALLGGFDPCLSIGIKTIVVKTKTSTSSSASIVDFINPIQYSMQIGPSANAGPDQARCTEGDSTIFPLHGQATQGLYPLISTNWSVVSGTATIDATDTLNTTAHVFSPTATLRLTVVQANGCTETDDIVLTVKPLPAGSISGPATVCPQSTTQFQGPAGMGGYSWSVSGNGSISGPANTRTVNVIAGPDCGASFTVGLEVTSNSCPGVASTEVMVNDTTAPILTRPADRVLECPADTRTNVTGVATAVDDCGKAAVSYSDSVTEGCGGTKVIARTWTTSDTCGNTTSAIQTITVRDITPPALTVPANVVLECPGDISTAKNGTATAQDACGSVTVTYSDSVSNSCGGTKVVSRLWTATDECGNATNRLQVLTVRDTTPPSLTVPANVVLECPADITPEQNGTATAQDACGSVTVTYSDSVSNSCGGTKIVSRLWTATDQCGNATNRLQILTVRDTTPPSLAVPANVVLECPGDISTAKNGTATAQDACGSVTVTYSDSISNSCGGTKIVSRLWTATDQCGNSTNQVQLLTVRDTTPPSLTVPANVVLECPGDISTARNGTATGSDACGSVTVTYSDSVSNSCGGTKVVSRLWTATDQCGNATSGLQILTVRDTTPPSLTVPASVVLECPGDISTAKNGTATAQDGCGSVTVTFSDSVSNSCGGTKIVSRLWTATDQCGNATNGLQILTVRDTTPPALVLPANLVLECPGDTRTNVTGVASASDACGSVTISYSDVVSNSCGGTKLVSRLWTATDQCGNSTSGLQTITVRDTTPPALKLPASLVLECPADTRTNVTGVATAPDACGSVTITYSDIVSNSCGNTRTLWRNWVATDQCGNSTNGLQTITVRDITKPTITCRAISVQCVGDVPSAYADLVAFLAAGNTATDACDSTLTFSLTSDSGLVGSCPGRVTRVYRVTDDCGNFAEGTQIITVDDTIAPVLRCPTNVTVECGSPLEPAILGSATATDNCDTNVTLTYTDTAVGSQYDIKFYAADSDINSGPYAPTYLKFGPAGLPCPSEAPLTGRAADPLRRAVAYGPTADQLDALMTLNGGSMSLGQIVPFEIVIEASGAPGPERGTIEFTADWATHTTSNDRFGYDTNYMIYCAFVDYADPGAIDPHYNAKVESYRAALVNRGTIDEQIRGTFRISGLDPGDRVVVEVWVVLGSTAPQSGGTVAAGLISAEKATLPPQLISTGVQTTGIGNLNKLNPLPAPQPQPALGPLPPQPPLPPGWLVSVLNRTWAATDTCGNRSTCAQQITIRDTMPPALNAPADLVLECPADVSTNNTGTASALEGCGQLTISFTDTVTNGCGGTKVVSRLWTATDGYNSTNRFQTITVLDTTPPTLALPADAVMECPGDVSTAQNGTATATDACGAVTVTYSDSTVSGCGSTKVVSRLWTATDACGNTTNALQTITVRDTTPPALTVPANVVLECPADLSTARNGTATATDTCGTVSVTFADAASAGTGGNRIITRTWTAADACGNTTNAVQTLTVWDTTPPIISYKLLETFTPAECAIVGTADQMLQDNFATVFPSGLVIGLGGAAGAVPGYTRLLWEPNSAGKMALKTLLGQTGGPSGTIAQSAVNPTSTFGGGTLALETIALTLNLGYNEAGLIGAGPNNLGSLIYASAADPLNGLTIAQILAIANKALAGQALPAGYDFNRLAALIANLNLSFHKATTSAWAAGHLTQPMLTVQCPSQVPPPDPTRVTTGDTCSLPVTVTSLPDAITDYVNAGHYTLLRTWMATDACGNSNTVSFPVLVNDITAPTLNPAPDRTVVAGTPWNFDQPGVADNCLTVTLDVVATITNAPSPTLIPGATTVTRTWSATDAAGNTANCQQTVTILPPPAPPTIAASPQCQSVASDHSTTLSVTASGTGPFTYQWQLNGVAISGATDSSLPLNNLQLTNAGLYSVVVANSGGSVTTPPAAVNVLPKLLMALDAHILRLSWPAGFILQAATSPAGPYTDVVGAVSPYLYDTLANPQKLFRLRAEPVRLTVTPLPDGQSSISSPGVPGQTFIIQASSDLVNWVNLGMGSSPISALDPDAAQYPRRYYRAIPASTRCATAPAIATQPVSQTAAFGKSATLTVNATGTGPFTYQWQRNGTNIAGATGSSLTLNNLQFADSGSYTVIVTSPAGTVTSQAAIITVAPAISITPGAQGLTLTWPGAFILQAASTPTGPYTNIPGATSPYPYNPLTAPQKFFRLRSN